MISDKCFKKEWLAQFKKQKEHERIDKIVLEKMIYALHLLERLKANGLDFVFKGGTSLVLLIDKGNRFSIDIDIICSAERSDLEGILNKVIETSNFTEWKLDDHRSYQPGVPKAHYKFFFGTNQQGSGTILLDVLVEDSLYPEIVQIPINTKWIETEYETIVNVPSIDAITGDKLTAFAPNTIGIPYFKGKDNQSFSMEICKQLSDLSKLFEYIVDIEMVAKSFIAFAEKEIDYRKNGKPDTELTSNKVLQDTIDTCIIISKRGGGSDDEKKKFAELQRGMKAFDSGFLMMGNFRIDDAVLAAARIAYVATKILLNDYSSITYYDGQTINELKIEEPEWNFLNKLKKLPDKSSFYYWYLTVNLLIPTKKEFH
jgi:predicted nucleotidyltransferase component of viral defense system